MKRGFALLVLCFPLLAASTVPGRYIVELSAEPVASRFARSGRQVLQSAAAQNHRAAIRAQQRQVRQTLEQQGARVIDAVENVANALLVQVPPANAAALAKAPGVAKVHPVRVFHLNLDRAAALHKAIAAWQQVGIDNAGLGVKIAIIDTGVDQTHPGFQDPGLTVPDGFPRANTDSDLAYTNKKIIVARSYAALFTATDPDPSPRDHIGHGTATAMAAAGISNAGPLAVISGVAPKAYIGNYKVFGTPGVNDDSPEDVVLKAVDDAVQDGMDIINLSLGSDLAGWPDQDPQVQALERAASLGVIVVAAAGNSGPEPNTISSPATGPSVIAVGASYNDRIFATTATVTGGDPVYAVPGSGRNPGTAISGPLVDVATLDGNGLACAPLPQQSLSGSIAFILRGTCTFEVKLNNAQAAGSIAALLYTYEEDPAPFTMGVGAATLPAQMIGYADGVAIKSRFPGPLEATLQFTRAPLYVSGDRIAGFSAKGPNKDATIKPDLVAVGANLYTATQSLDAKGALFSTAGYVVMSGTSFSSPLVAGAAAVLKAARPGLTQAQYRSLLINSAARISLDTVTPARVQQGGTGLLDVSSAVRSTIAASPTALSFGTGDGTVDRSMDLTLSNVGTAEEIYLISALPRDAGPAPALRGSSITLGPGASAVVPVRFTAAALAAGQYEGYIVVQGTSSGVETRIPYWYAVPGAPQYVTTLHVQDQPQAGTTVRSAFFFQVTDVSGVLLRDLQPEVTVVSGGGSVLRVRNSNSIIPGAWAVDVLLGLRPGTQQFQIKVGDITKVVSLVAR